MNLGNIDGHFTPMKSNNWSWFMSADIAGTWIVTQGKANVHFVEQQFHGELVYEDSQGDLVSIQAKIEGNCFREHEVEMKVIGPEAPPFF
jgi:hypothetical protein